MYSLGFETVDAYDVHLANVMLGGSDHNGRRYDGRKLFTGAGFQEMIDEYLSKGGDMYQIDEGTLGWGTFILTAPGCWNVRVQEVYMSPYKSLHVMTRRRNMPKSWIREIDDAESRYLEDED